MSRKRSETRLAKGNVAQALALLCLLAMGGWVIAGPSGLFAWSDNLRTLEKRQAELKQLDAERAVLRNRVALLDPHNTDPDITRELLHSNLNVVHPDEMVMLIK
ncbi:MAG: septum formation initiator [Novosphingobium sp.]